MGYDSNAQEPAWDALPLPPFPRERALLAVSLKTEILTEKWQHVILESIGDGADMRAGIDFEAVRDAVVVKDSVEFASVDAQAILIADVNRDSAVLFEIADVLIDKGKR